MSEWNNQKYMALIIGGSASGKSACAEKLAVSFAADPKGAREAPLIYLATMQRDGKEAEERIRKHRNARKGRGFRTLEKERNAAEIIPDIPENAVVLLECLPNLLANEMFPAEENMGVLSEGGTDSAKDFETDMRLSNREGDTGERIFSELLQIRQAVGHLLIVSDDIFSDGIQYGETTEQYRKILAELHKKLAEVSDCVIEVSAGIPFILKNK